MPSMVEIIIAAQDRSGPAFASASQGVRGLGVATDATAGRITTLTDRTAVQQRQLALLERQLAETTEKHGIDSIAVQRQALTYDRLTLTIRANERELSRLHDEQRRGVLTTGQIGSVTVVTQEATRAMTGFGTAVTGVGSALASVGGLFAAEQGKEFVIDALRAANAYTTVETTLRSLTGTQQLYNETLAVARQNQDILGGSMADQLTAMSALIPLVRTTNAELATLSTTQQLLALRTPTEGMGGAAFALQEMLTSTSAEGVRSLAERFNLPRNQLQQIMQQTQGDQQAQLLAIQELLAAQGITMNTLEDQARSAATPFRQVSTAWSNFMLREGQAAQNLFGPLATTATGALNLVSGARPVRESLGQVREGLGQEFGLIPRERPDQQQQTAAIQQTGAPATVAPVVYQTINVQGSVITEQQLADTMQARLLEKQRQNGTTGLR